MSFTTQTVTARVTVSKNEKITNLSMPLAGTEYSLSLQDNLKKIIIRNRISGTVKIAFVSGETGTKYITIPRGTNLELSDLDFSSKILYAQSNVASSILEVLELY